MAVLSALALAASVIGTGLSVYGQAQAASAAKASGKYNAKIQQDQAKQEMQAMGENARRKTRENARILGQQRAALAQSGLAMEGTPLAILGESAMTLHRDVLDMGYTAANKARQLQAGASMSLFSGSQQSKAGMLSAVGTGISGVAGAAADYGNDAGLFAPSAPSVPRAIPVY